MRSVIVSAPDMDPSQEISTRGDLGRARDALRRDGHGRAWLVEDQNDMRLDGAGPLLTISGNCLPHGDDRESAAILLDRILAERWRIQGMEDVASRQATRVQNDIRETLKALGYGLDVKIGVVLPTPTSQGRAIVGRDGDRRADAVVAHLARDSPIFLLLTRRDDQQIRIAATGTRIHLPSPVGNPVEALRLLSTLPKDLLG